MNFYIFGGMFLVLLLFLWWFINFANKHNVKGGKHGISKNEKVKPYGT